MRRAPLLAAGLIMVASPLQGQDRFAGDWNGVLDVGAAQLRLVLHIQASDEGYTAAMDSPDQGAFGIPASSVAATGDTIVIDFSDIAGQYRGTIDADGTMVTGTWSQSGQTFPLTLTPGPAEEARRPQNPRPPFPYGAQDVAFPGGAAGVTLAGTLTIPPGTGPFAAAILVSGSGPQDRNEEIFQHKPFLVLADFLTRRGIVVLRYDDRGVGESTGSFGTATTEDFAADARAAVRFLRQRDDVDPGAVGVIGHSEGGIIAQLVAAMTPDLGYIVSIAGPGIPGDSILMLQVDAMNAAMGLPPEQRTSANALQRGLLDIVRSDAAPEAARAEIAALLRAEGAKLPEAQASAQAAALTSPWMRWFVRYDPAPILAGLKLPVLAVNGSRDLQVLAEPNLAAIAAALHSAGNADFTIVELDGLNHLLQTADTGLVTEYAHIEETMAPRALETIGDWIVARFGST